MTSIKEKLFSSIIKSRKLVVILFLLLCILCGWLSAFVKVDSDLTDYLPKDSDSTLALSVMQKEFDEELSNVSILVKDISFNDATKLAKKIKKVDGVTSVSWIGNLLPKGIPLSILPDSIAEKYYKNKNALIPITINESFGKEVLDEIRSLTDKDLAFSGTFVNSKVAQASSRSEILRVVVIVIIFGLLLLMLTLDSFLEPLILVVCLGIAVILNAGTNLVFGSISSVTKTASSVLQMGVSVDYSIFLLHRYREYIEAGIDNENAMIKAMCSSLTSILSSSLTTIIGFLALLFMRYRIGLDMGLVLSKGIAISLICAFTILPCLVLILDPFISRTRHKAFIRQAAPIAKISRSVRVPAMVIFLLLLIPAFFMQSHNKYYYGMSRLYKTSHYVSKEAKEIEDAFGRSNTMVFLVPKGDDAKEEELIMEIQKIDSCRSVLSYVGTLGSYPEALIPDSLKSLLRSDNYSRFVMTFDTDNESKATFDLIQKLKKLGEKYYGDQALLIGNSVSVYDLKQIISADSIKVNLIAVIAIFIVLFFSFKNLLLPIMLTLSIEGSIWICMAISYVTGSYLFYIGYLIVSSILLGSTVDYAILVTSRFEEYQKTLSKKEALNQSITISAVSVFTSGLILSMAGLLLYFFCVNQLIAQLGLLLCRGTMLAVLVVLTVLPGMLLNVDTIFHS